MTLNNTHSMARTASRDELIVQHEHLVYSVAHRYAVKGCRPDRSDYMDRCEDLESYLLVELVAIVDDYLRRGVQGVPTVGCYLRSALEHCAVNYHRAGHDDILGRPEYRAKGQVVRRGEAVFSLERQDERGQGLQDVLEGGDGVQSEQDYAVLYEAIGRLTKKRQESIGVRFGLIGWGSEESLYAGGASRGLSTKALYDRFYNAVRQLREDVQLAEWFAAGREVSA